jgi:predicted permease
MLVSAGCGAIVARGFGFKKRARNFVMAMAVFGNSNSLPISLVTSLAFTIKGLHWDKEPGDNDSSVATRGITYLVVFQQLGQIVRWTWGYKGLLAPPENYEDDELEESELKDRVNARMEAGHVTGLHGEYQTLLVDGSDRDSLSSGAESLRHTLVKVNSQTSPSDYGSGVATPMNANKYASSASTCSCVSEYCEDSTHIGSTSLSAAAGGHHGDRHGDHHGEHSRNGHTLNGYQNGHSAKPTLPKGPKGWWIAVLRFVAQIGDLLKEKVSFVTGKISSASRKAFSTLPEPLQNFLAKTGKLVWELLSAPLIAMLLALPFVLSPTIKNFVYGTPFLEHSFIRAVKQTGDVAVPLIIVVLGANLARNTLPADQRAESNGNFEKKLMIASLLSRMLLPLLVMAPLLALTARYLPINILGDPIFIIVCFLLVGAPSALQLAQICQINNAYMGTMSSLLFHSYVVWYVFSIVFLFVAPFTNVLYRILPSTLILVMCALETLEWAQSARL